jgi:Holliday junction resolvase-like predicted endonuclease
MAEFKAEMAASRERSEKEMAEFKAEMRSFRKELGGISNKMGTLVEDLVVPAIRPLITRYFQDEILDISPRRKRRVKSLGIRGEFDVIAVSADTVYLVDVKSNAEKKDIDTFASTTVPRFKELFPEYEQLKLVLIFASLYLEQETIDYATEKKMYALAYKEWDYMDLLNFEAVSAV